MEPTPTQPKVSILMSTYNRADLLPKAMDSIIGQTYRDFELVVINNGSTDDTAEVLKNYEQDPRVRVLTLPVNRGCAGGLNFGLGQLNGEWFGTISDDDYLTEDALAIMMRIPEEVDPEVNAVTANCRSKATGGFSGKGLDKDQYLDLETIVSKCSGEFWGLVKVELLGDLRFNEELIGFENTLWYKIDAVAKRYYIHQAVQVFDDVGETISTQSQRKDLQRKVEIYRVLLQEEFYWEVVKKYYRKKYQEKCFKGWLFLTIAGEREGAAQYARMLMESGPGLKYRLMKAVLGSLGGRLMHFVYQLLPRKSFKMIIPSS